MPPWIIDVAPSGEHPPASGHVHNKIVLCNAGLAVSPVIPTLTLPLCTAVQPLPSPLALRALQMSPLPFVLPRAKALWPALMRTAWFPKLVFILAAIFPPDGAMSSPTRLLPEHTCRLMKPAATSYHPLLPPWCRDVLLSNLPSRLRGRTVPMEAAVVPT